MMLADPDGGSLGIVQFDLNRLFAEFPLEVAPHLFVLLEQVHLACRPRLGQVDVVIGLADEVGQ